MENIDDLNFDRFNDLTIEEVKNLPMFKDFSDMEAAEVIQTIKRLSEIIVNDYSKREDGNENRL